MITAVEFVLSGLVIAGIAYDLACLFCASRFFLRPEPCVPWRPAPVTILVPLCDADPEAFENYSALCRQDYPEYQIVFGVRSPDDTAVPVVRRVREAFPAREIDLVISSETIGHNLKVSNLHNMLSRARHEIIVIMDSDVRVGEDFLSEILPPLQDEGVGIVTCLYRAARASSFASRIEAVGITAEFHPGVLVARMLEGMTFALGAALATTRTKLRAIGDLEAVADHLADDYMLGNLMARAGYRVRLSRYVVELVGEPPNFAAMLRHQVRWARGTRICRPRGYLGLVISHGVALSLLNVAAGDGSAFTLILLAAAFASRSAVGWLVGVRWLQDRVLRRNFWLLPVRDVLSLALWCAGLFGRRVEWRGRTLEVLRDGRIAPVG